MRVKIVRVLRTGARWISRILEVHLRMGLVYGLPADEAAQKSRHA
jgi:hypothetical protein